jgi:hypothetical protein
MTRAVEDTNRRLLRARDAMDLTYGRALDGSSDDDLTVSCGDPRLDEAV